jgi:hypothetical protein
MAQPFDVSANAVNHTMMLNSEDAARAPMRPFSLWPRVQG